MDDSDNRTRVIVICTPDTTADVLFALRHMHGAGQLTEVVDTFPIRPRTPSPLDVLMEERLDFVTERIDELIRTFDESTALRAPPRPPTWTPDHGRRAKPPPPPPPIRSQRPRRRQP